ncbi:hypothetical protein NQ024_07855 [Corynebacterium sp. 35RC1]|nr:hypothetical protein [Corynebacterium sp. 35RC1]
MLFLVAALLFLAGVALWWLDARRRNSQQFSAADSGPVATEEIEPQSQPVSEPQPQPDQASVNYGATEEIVDAQVEAELVALPAVEPESLQVEPVEIAEEDIEFTSPRAAQLQPQPQPVPASPDRDAPRRQAFGSFPGAPKREKRAWAQQHGFAYVKQDAYLAEEWVRVQGSAKDVVSGVSGGYETHLLELGGATVMAIRRAQGSEVVLEARREGSGSEDLQPVRAFAGFGLRANEQGAVERFLDERVDQALQELPAAVQMVWWESEWVLAQFAKGSDQADWDATLAPLAALAAAARVLPPRKGAKQPVEFQEFDPTRAFVQVVAAPEEPDDDELPALPDVPQRPAEPLSLPSRAVGASHGEVELRQLGEDEVRSIGEQAQAPQDFQGTRVLRDTSAGSSIFDDIVAELGDPTQGANDGN